MCPATSEPGTSLMRGGSGVGPCEMRVTYIVLGSRVGATANETPIPHRIRTTRPMYAKKIHFTFRISITRVWTRFVALQLRGFALRIEHVAQSVADEV